MVSWAVDGTISGYNPTTEEQGQNVFFLTENGSPVDLAASGGGGTRLQRYLAPQQIDPRNNIRAEVRLTFLSSDFVVGVREYLGALMYIAVDSAFGGTAPTTAQEVIDKAFVVYSPSEGYGEGGVYSSGGYTSVPGTFNFYFDGLKPTAGTQITPNTKLWVVVTPAGFRAGNPTAAPFATDKARSLSLWTNRTPAKPTITSPVNGAVISPGGTFTLTYDPNDPDALTPDGTNGSNADLAGVQIQYAPAPSPDNPTPVWRDLPRVNADGDTAAESWYLDGTEYGLAGDSSLLTARGSSVMCGVDTVTPGNGVLPGGTWQLRVRTFDYGHPYPNLYRPAGFTTGGSLTPDAMPTSLVSPWSDAITVSVPSPVSPPLLIAPVDNVAVLEGQSVRMMWKHRSAFVTPKPQAAREVQIRKVGDPTWSTVFAGASTQEFADLPATYVAPPAVLPSEYLTDVGFEGGTLGGWSTYDPFDTTNGTETLSNVLNAGEAHAGSRYLRLNYAASGWPGFQQVVTLNPIHDSVRFTAWVHPPDAATTTVAGVIWLDASNNPLPDEVQSEGWSATKVGGGAWPSPWMQADSGDLVPPVGAVKARLVHYSYDLVGFVDTGFGGARMDDVSFIGTYSGNTDDFSMVATTRYEWRARTKDNAGSWSSFSPVERFWVVPPGNADGDQPVPSETIDGATLGCGTHRVEVYRRGGKTRIGELTGVSHLDWSRTRDDISTAQVIIKDWDIDCGNLLASLQTWAYELVITRTNGYGTERVWEGPITLLTYETDTVKIDAKDVMAYAYRRILKQQMNDSGTGNGTTVTDRAARVLRNALASDDPNVLEYLTVLAQADDAMQYRNTPAYSRTAFEEVDDMAANAGLDYTTVGRRILLWGTKHRIGTLPEMRDENLGNAPIVSEYGMSMANRYVVSDGNGVWGEATRLDVSGNDPVYGLVEMLSSSWASDSPEDAGTYTDEGLETIRESFRGFAERSIADRFPPPVVVRVPDNTTLQPGTPLSIQHLVPGVVIPLRSTGTLRKVAQSQKLDSVKVVEEDGRETISVTMSPFSRDDASVEEGGEV